VIELLFLDLFECFPGFASTVAATKVWGMAGSLSACNSASPAM